MWLALLSRLGGEVTPAVVPVDAGEKSTPVVAAKSESYRLDIFHSEQKVGYSASSLRAVPDGYRLRQETRLRLTVLEEQREVHTRLSARLGADRAVHALVVSLESEGAHFRAQALRVGDVLRYEAGFGGDRTRGEIDLGAGVALHLPATARAVVAKGLAVGREFEFSVLDPLGLRVAPFVARVVGLERPADLGAAVWRVEETYRGMKAEVWLDETGRVWAEEAPMGFTARSATPAQRLRARASLDVADATAIRVGRIGQPRKRAAVRLRLTGIARERIPQGHSQEFDGEDLLLRRVKLDEVGSYRLPYAGGGEAAAELGPGQWIQSDHPRLRALAREILGDETDALRATRLLTTWVYEYLEKVPTLGIPNALAALDAARGDCNEHAVLLTALARAAGLPSRVVAGLVYADERFVYHAWSEVWGERGWFPVDPAFGQVPADATHIALAHGELWEVAQLADLVGRIRLEFVPDS